jgi:hypothetical protein
VPSDRAVGTGVSMHVKAPDAYSNTDIKSECL